MEDKMNIYTRKWLDSTSGLSDVALYSRQANSKLLFKANVEKFKSGKTWHKIMLDDSKDEVIKSPKPTLKTGKKWNARDTIRSARDNIAFKEIIIHIENGNQVFGTNEKQRWTNTSGKNYRNVVIQDVGSEVDNKTFLKRVHQSQQGQWTNWEETLKNSITWKGLWQMALLWLSFLKNSTYYQLTSKSNFRNLKKENGTFCPLCNDKPQALEHVLRFCKIALGKGRSTLRHNRVLEDLIKFIKNCMKSEPTISTQKTFIERGRTYAGAMQTIKLRSVPSQNLLGSSEDWEVSDNLPGWYYNYPKLQSCIFLSILIWN